MRLRSSHVLLAVLILILMSGTCRRAGAQTRMVYGPAASAYLSSTEANAPGGLGGLLGIERQFSEGISLSVVGSVLHTIRTADGASICRPAPNDGCLPRALFPLWITALELQASIAFAPGLPLRLLGAGGGSVSHDAREYWRGAPRTAHGAEVRMIWRGGFEVRLGRRRESPRLQFTRASFGAEPFSLSALKTVALILTR